MHQCHSPPLDPGRELPSIHRVPLKEEERESWLEFKKLDEGIRPLFGLTKQLAEQGKRPIEIYHPFVRVIGDFAINAFNKACETHVKKGEHHNLHDFEHMECKYLKLTKAYYFYMTIEAIEEGDLGVYEAVIVCGSDDGRKTLSKLILTNRKPVGKRAIVISKLSRLRSMHKTVKVNTAKVISHLSRLTSIYETVKRAKKDITVHLRATRKYMKGKKKSTTTAELVRLKEHHKKAIRGLRKVLSRDTRTLFPPACSRTTDGDGWSDPDEKTGMVRRTEGNTSKGYDYYNRLKAFAPSLIW